MDARQAAEELGGELLEMAQGDGPYMDFGLIKAAMNRFAADVLDQAAREVPTDRPIPGWLQAKAKELRDG